MFDVLTAFGLSSAAGLNAYLPLLIVGLLGRYTDLITLQAPWNLLENGWVIGVLIVLLVIEMTVDKIPAVDTANDVLQTVIRPLAGAILFAANGNAITDVHPVVGVVLGILVAGGIHGVKATARPVVTATTAGVGNPIVSVIEDVISGVMTVLAIVLPLLTVVLLAIALLLIWRAVRRFRAGRRPQTG